MLKIIQKISTSHSLCECNECGGHYKVNHKPSKLNALSHLCDLCSSTANQVVNQSLVKKFFNYDSTTGILTWRLPTRTTSVGDVAGTRTLGYIQVCVANKCYKAHHLIWLYCYGYLPNVIDHINHDGYDNSLANLREVSQTENNRNQPKRSDNKSGHTGIRITVRGTYEVRIAKKHIGTFKTELEALDARNKAYRALNFHPNHGN